MKVLNFEDLTKNVVDEFINNPSVIEKNITEANSTENSLKSSGLSPLAWGSGLIIIVGVLLYFIAT